MRYSIWSLGISCCVLMSVVSQAAIIVDNAYVREMPPGAPVTAAFLVLRNDGETARVLTGVQTTLADRAEIHNHTMQSGKMVMRPVGQVKIPARGELSFKPGGYHIMVFGLKRRLSVGETLPLLLIFADGQHVPVDADVRSLKTAGH